MKQAPTKYYANALTVVSNIKTQAFKRNIAVGFELPFDLPLEYGVSKEGNIAQCLPWTMWNSQELSPQFSPNTVFDLQLQKFFFKKVRPQTDVRNYRVNKEHRHCYTLTFTHSHRQHPSSEKDVHLLMFLLIVRKRSHLKIIRNILQHYGIIEWVGLEKIIQ